MGIYKQIIFLSIVLVLVMVSCVFVHIKDIEVENITISKNLENNLVEEKNNIIETTTTITNNEEAIKEESLKLEEEIKEQDLEKENLEVKKEELQEESVISSVLPSNQRIEELSKRIEPKLQEEIILEEKVENTDVQEKLDLVFKDEKIVFKRLSTNITDESKILLKRVTEILNEYKGINIEIGGHTDAKGKADVNQWISLQRAISVKKELIKQGISKDRIKTKGYGETKPLVANNENGYSIENRRVEIKVIEE